MVTMLVMLTWLWKPGVVVVCLAAIGCAALKAPVNTCVLLELHYRLRSTYRYFAHSLVGVVTIEALPCRVARRWGVLPATFKLAWLLP